MKKEVLMLWCQALNVERGFQIISTAILLATIQTTLRTWTFSSVPSTDIEVMETPTPSLNT
jgi:hypothetical protein